MQGHPLELLLRPLWSSSVDDGSYRPDAGGPRVVCRPGEGDRGWLRAGDWQVFVRSTLDAGAGDELAAFMPADGTGARMAVAREGEVIVPFSLADAFRSYVAEEWRVGSANRAVSERGLNAFYRVKAMVPRRAQLAARRWLIKRQGIPEFPAWPLDTSVSRLLRFYALCSLRAAGRTEAPFLWFWPEHHRAAVILTHDVEGDEGARLALTIADLEEEHGFRSSFNFGAWYDDLDPGILRDLAGRGFEIGLHGLTHDRQLFASRQAFEERLQPLGDLARRLGAVGFRSPATHRVFDWLGELPIDYDCTIPNSDPYEPQPGGCCSVWPFFVGDVVELPYTLPQDHTLLTLLAHRTPALWLESAAALEAEFGLIQCVSHPDPGYLGDLDKRAVYAELLQGLAERPGLWRALPRDVADWWRRRAAASPSDGAFARGTARIDETTGEVVLVPPG